MKKLLSILLISVSLLGCSSITFKGALEAVKGTVNIEVNELDTGEALEYRNELDILTASKAAHTEKLKRLGALNSQLGKTLIRTYNELIFIDNQILDSGEVKAYQVVAKKELTNRLGTLIGELNSLKQ